MKTNKQNQRAQDGSVEFTGGGHLCGGVPSVSGAPGTISGDENTKIVKGFFSEKEDNSEEDED